VADLDTTSKRRSHLSLCKPWIAVLPEPTGAIEAGDRQHLAYLYSGISAGGAEAITGTGAITAPLGTISGTGEAGYPNRSIWEFNRPERRRAPQVAEAPEPPPTIIGRGAVTSPLGQIAGTGLVLLPVIGYGACTAPCGTVHGYGAVPDDAADWALLGLDVDLEMD
jgi:hypothetical protein